MGTILKNEELWAKWKENKCPNFERPASEACRLKTFDAKRYESKNVGQGGNLVAPREGKINDKRNGRQMKEYFKLQKEDVDAEGNSINIKPCDMPTLSDYLYSFLCDQDHN